MASTPTMDAVLYMKERSNSDSWSSEGAATTPDHPMFTQSVQGAVKANSSSYAAPDGHPDGFATPPHTPYVPGLSDQDLYVRLRSLQAFSLVSPRQDEEQLAEVPPPPAPVHSFDRAPGSSVERANGAGSGLFPQSESVLSPHMGNLVEISLGSRSHPHNCAAACRYVKRKGGCRNGAACPNCHLCFWSRPQQHLPLQQPPAPLAAARVQAPEASNMELREPAYVTFGEVSDTEPAYIQVDSGATTPSYPPPPPAPVVPDFAGRAASYGWSAVPPPPGLHGFSSAPVAEAFNAGRAIGAPMTAGRPGMVPRTSPGVPISRERPGMVGQASAVPKLCLMGSVMSKGSVGHPYTCALACKYNSKAKGCKDGADCTFCHACPWRRFQWGRNALATRF